MESNYINLQEAAITRHAGVEFAVQGGRHYVHCGGEWVCLSEADFKMVLGRVQAEPECELSVKRSGAWAKFWLWNGVMSWIEVPLACLIDPDTWSMTDEVTFPDFDPARHVAQDPEPELYHPFAFVDAGRSKGYFVRAHDDAGMVWVRISKGHWDRCMKLFHSNSDDDPEGKFYNHTTIGGVVANDEYRCVFLDVNPMGERGEIEFYLRDLATERAA